MYDFSFKKVSQMTGREFFCVERLRCDSFVVEQKITLPELDDIDLEAIQVFLLNKEKTNALATCRLFQDKDLGWMIGRVAVAKNMRHQKLGTKMMQQVHAYLQQLSVNKLTCHAQLSAQGFYKYLGYQASGPIFDEGGIEHVMMYRKLDSEGKDE